MTKLTLKPVDTFFFKNHHVTEAGEDTVMESMFPPRPNTIYGALRAAYIHTHTTFDEFVRETDEHVKRWMGTPNQRGEFRLQYCALTYKQDILLPLPLDYQVIEEKKSLKAYPLLLANDEKPSSLQGKWRLASTRREKTKSSQHQYVSLQEWKHAILHEAPISSLISLSKLVVREEKVGIRLDIGSRTAQEGLLYRVMQGRFRDDGALAVYIGNGPDFSKVKFARIGGENRPWIIQQSEETFTLWDEKEKKQLAEKIAQTKVAKIIFLSPAIFESGSRPCNFDGEKVTLPNGVTVKWLTAAIGRPELYGGWDIVRHRPKPRKWMVPAGSVIYVEVEEEDISKLLFVANGMHFTDEGAEEGFGFAVIASASKSEEEL
ncbi:type III-B CRISPR module-associated protein Cmr3 [Parageobacillus thermoglucosidasius]|uniref:Type III-B CRISPR module-associated protein Cmr3 n=1 Tax=Parageobacillus thermoglucosidasius TaxID=1426 RepID=A0AAN0YP70_PARTM|nr:type III-B CRISPR module-associated protein Cmr3 [Parageobacillus thermoglucosidasius]AEH47997.1 CRISPR-associated protein, Cmr3 [Parageobacillus thermoglucosidasius C56-YS93]ALF10770.1 CRISPR-associated protein Cmr3 [Parageobacillus thermoglucosidasius]ANZ30848.1 type III-B CRISPR module-associated protein Cmr3 [Parageobacillus thermoglucosidasius]APM81585.1 type III-B CRISPR module-associated protein Cmr3 [Parageobacillus thermoglucosidasius]KJX67664.1 CRISPR-associated protein Cmr3 [Para